MDKLTPEEFKARADEIIDNFDRRMREITKDETRVLRKCRSDPYAFVSVLTLEELGTGKENVHPW